MRNSTQLENTDWQRTEEGWQTEFACPVVYLGDLSWIACDCSEPTEFFLNGEYLCSRDRGAGHISLSEHLRPGRNCLETRGGSGHPDISLLVTPRSHFRVHEEDRPSLGCSCSWVPGSGILKVQAQLADILPGDTLRLILRDPEGEILDQVEVNADRLDPVDLVTTRNVLWEGTTQPDRLELVAQLRRRGMVKDEIRLFTGLRTYSLDSRRNFLLNGHPYPLKGKVLEEPESLEDILAQGYNAVWDRSGQPAARLLEEADRLGLVVFSTIGDHDRQLSAAQGHVSLCFWVQEEGGLPSRDVTRLSLEVADLDLCGQEFTIGH
ncbi:hypothetical protein [Faecalibaculum rodentium]|uniref:hypothetical protein n=1 Tax=Faecalibaculum rodentium TaxID=1702221 RepID=UPI0023F34345|nr:hypothetical protein [Faecalibaculum rodentium]